MPTVRMPRRPKSIAVFTTAFGDIKLSPAVAVHFQHATRCVRSSGSSARECETCNTYMELEATAAFVYRMGWILEEVTERGLVINRCERRGRMLKALAR